MQYYDKILTGERIRSCRIKMNMTQSQLSELLGFSTERHVQRIERGQSSISIGKLVELSQVLGMTTDYILIGRKSEDEERVLAAIRSLTEDEILLLLEVVQVILRYSKHLHPVDVGKESKL